MNNVQVEKMLKMEKKVLKKNNALVTIASLSKKIQSSKGEVLRLYSDGIAMIIPKPKRPVKIKTDALEKQIREEIESLSAFLKISPLHTLLFVAAYTKSTLDNNSFNVEDIPDFFKITDIDFLPLKAEFNVLVQKGLINKTGFFGVDYRITDLVEESLQNNIPFEPSRIKKMDRYKFCSLVKKAIDSIDNDELETLALVDKISALESENAHIEMIGKLKQIIPDTEDRIMFYIICDDYLGIYDREVNLDNMLSSIYDDSHTKFSIERDILDKKHPIIATGLSKLNPSEFMTDACVELDERGKVLFFEDDFQLFAKTKSHNNLLLSPEKIPERQLFFNKKLMSDIDFVKESLTEKRFAEIQDSLVKHNLQKGVAALFYGAPGTGKTASVEMIVKATGRSVYHVDIASSKSCWFGESEKIIKGIFTDYAEMCKTEPIKPILLFNEADALFSKRVDVESSNVAQTENAIQNIILEQMEKLDGILIATTNLMNNLDSAFNRRFLFKIRFDRPDNESKQAIWKSKLEWLPDSDCKFLASNFNLTGGEIDNIVRKTIMEEILKGKRPDIEKITEWCKEEKVKGDSFNTIGYKN